MGLFKLNLQESRHMMLLLIIKMVFWFGWYFSIALAQLEISDALTGSVNLPVLGIACIGNIAVFITCLIRGKLDFENSAKEVLTTLTGPKLQKINGMNGKGLTTIWMPANESTEEGFSPIEAEERDRRLEGASIVMLSNGTPNSSMTHFTRYNAVNDVHSILLQYEKVKMPMCKCKPCNCIAFWTLEKITSMLELRMPRTLKPLNDSRCLIPCRRCLTNGCHRCINQESPLPLPLPDEEKLRESVVTDILDNIVAGSNQAGGPICICIPLKAADDDEWTKLLISSLRSKDAEARGVRVEASKALEGYLDRVPRRGIARADYNIASFILPRLTEIVINLGLTFLLKVDGLSSSLSARRPIRDYLVNSSGSGLAANAFLTRAVVKSDDNNTQVCQVLTFRIDRLSFRALSFTSGTVNLICGIGWAVLISCESDDSSPPLSGARVAVIISAIGIALFMDCLYLYANWLFSGGKLDFKVLPVITLEIVCIVAGSLVYRSLGIKAVGKWVYGALQALVWLKWGFGSYILNKYRSEDYSTWGVLVYSSAFLLNALLAVVRSKWRPSLPWKF